MKDFQKIVDNRVTAAQEVNAARSPDLEPIPSCSTCKGLKTTESISILARCVCPEVDAFGDDLPSLWGSSL